LPTKGEDNNGHDSSEIEMSSPTNKRHKTSIRTQVQIPVGVAVAESKAIVYGYLTRSNPPALRFRIDNAHVKRKSQTDFSKEQMKFEQIEFYKEFNKSSEMETRDNIKRKLIGMRESSTGKSFGSKIRV
jgi:hypothetical protein